MYASASCCHCGRRRRDTGNLSGIATRWRAGGRATANNLITPFQANSDEAWIRVAKSSVRRGQSPLPVTLIAIERHKLELHLTNRTRFLGAVEQLMKPGMSIDFVPRCPNGTAESQRRAVLPRSLLKRRNLLGEFRHASHHLIHQCSLRELIRDARHSQSFLGEVTSTPRCPKASRPQASCPNASTCPTNSNRS